MFIPKSFDVLSYRLVRWSLFFILIVILGCKGPSEQGDKIHIGFSQGLGNHPWRQSMNHAMEIQASLHF